MSTLTSSSNVPTPDGSNGPEQAPNIGAPPPAGGQFRDLLRLVTVNRKVLIGLIIILFFILVAIFGPIFPHQDPSALTNDTMAAPSAAHWLGTTETGQDVFAQLLVGTRTSVLWGFLTGLAVMAISIILGITAGYMGGLVDDIISLFTNVFLLIPFFPLALILTAFFPFKGLITVSVVLVITGWPWNARVLRAQTLSLRNRDFVEAARSSGEHTWRIIFFEIMPNEISIIMANLIGAITYAITATVGLQFLGLGKATDVSWGTILYLAQNGDALFLGAWWWLIPAGLCVALVAAGLALINFGVDEVANPKLRTEINPEKLQRRRARKMKKAVA